MKLEFQRLGEANDLVNQLIEHHPFGIFLSDSTFKIKLFNKSFQDLTKREKHEILDHEFCEIIGCTNHGNGSLQTNHSCKKCQMRDLLSEGNLSELSLIRDFNIKNKMVTKHLHIVAHKIIMGGVKYQLVVIEDKTQKV